jgi:hypothetical protein
VDGPVAVTRPVVAEFWYGRQTLDPSSEGDCGFVVRLETNDVNFPLEKTDSWELLLDVFLTI